MSPLGPFKRLVADPKWGLGALRGCVHFGQLPNEPLKLAAAPPLRLLRHVKD